MLVRKLEEWHEGAINRRGRFKGYGPKDENGKTNKNGKRDSEKHDSIGINAIQEHLNVSRTEFLQSIMKKQYFNLYMSSVNNNISCRLDEFGVHLT